MHSLSYEQFLVGVYFPIGETCAWKHIWTGKQYAKQGSEALVEAPIGYPAIFVKANSTIGETFLKYLREYNVLERTTHLEKCFATI